MQTGLECIGDIDIFDVIEVINLGLKSLALISDSFTLDLSHMGVVSAILD
jgi:ATP phosphoribosyltransferase regulatory subunit